MDAASPSHEGNVSPPLEPSEHQDGSMPLEGTPTIHGTSPHHFLKMSEFTVVVRNHPVRAAFHCNLNDGYNRLNFTNLNELDFQFSRPVGPLPAGLKLWRFVFVG